MIVQGPLSKSRDTPLHIWGFHFLSFKKLDCGEDSRPCVAQQSLCHRAAPLPWLCLLNGVVLKLANIPVLVNFLSTCHKLELSKREPQPRRCLPQIGLRRVIDNCFETAQTTVGSHHPWVGGPGLQKAMSKPWRTS